MPDTAEIPEAAGQPENDDMAQQLLADAAADSDPRDGEEQEQAGGDPWADPEKARKEIETLRRRNSNYRLKLKEAEPQLAEYKQYLDSRKTEQERLAEAKSAAEARLAEVMATNARLMAAATHGIPAELIDLLGAGTEDEIDARARLLAERLAAPSDPTPPAAPRPASTRPVESLTAGGRPADDPPPLDMDAYLRRMAGRG